MGFADLSIAEIAEDYHLPVEEILRLCDQLGIAYRNPQTRLALEDAKALISSAIAQRQVSDSQREDSPGESLAD